MNGCIWEIFERIDGLVYWNEGDCGDSNLSMDYGSLWGLFFEQLITQFMKHEGFMLGGGQAAEVILGRDTRPSGEALLEAAKQVGSDP